MSFRSSSALASSFRQEPSGRRTEYGVMASTTRSQVAMTTSRFAAPNHARWPVALRRTRAS
jgi:hypothetical protein